MKRIITLGIQCHQPQDQAEIKLTHPQISRLLEPFFVGPEDANWTQSVVRRAPKAFYGLTCFGYYLRMTGQV